MATKQATGSSAADPIVLDVNDDDDDEEVVGQQKPVLQKSKKRRLEKDPAAAVPSSIPYNHPQQDAFPASASFRTALNDLVSSFEAHEHSLSHRIHRLVCYSTPDTICFYDKYHKARKHLLLIPRPNSPLGKVNSVTDIVPSAHLEHLRNFHSLGRAIASAVGGGERYPMLCGYHSVPSLMPLHLHLISSDFVSDCIKNKKHINTFTNSSFFISPEVLERHMQSAPPSDGAHVKVNTERANTIINASPFSCFRCGSVSANVPQWKQHNRGCNAKLPDDYGRVGSSSLLGWEGSGKGAGSGKKSKAEGHGSGKDIRKFFGSDRDGGEGSIH